MAGGDNSATRRQGERITRGRTGSGFFEQVKGKQTDKILGNPGKISLTKQLLMMQFYRKVQHLEAELETFEDKMLLAAQKLDVVSNDGNRDIDHLTFGH